MDCVKCSFRRAMPGSPFCAVCARGIETVLFAPKREAESVSRRPRHFTGRPARVARSRGSRSEGMLCNLRERERIRQKVSQHLRQIEFVRPKEFDKIRPDIRMIKERRPIDSIGWYDSEICRITLDDDAVKSLSILIRCDPKILGNVVRIHAIFHEALHSYLDDGYVAIDHRLIEHFIHHMMFYLLIDPKHSKELLPDLVGSFGRLSETGSYYRVFLAVHELQPENCRVKDADFGTYPQTWVLDSMSIVRRYHVRDFVDWDKLVFCRNGRIPQSLVE